jgi:thiamine-monophosphate kinase
MRPAISNLFALFLGLEMKDRGSQPRKSSQKCEPPIGERALIAAIRDRSTRQKGMVRVGIGDDGAVLRPRAGEEIVVTTDFSLEQVHFRRDWHTPEVAGHRCLARGLSDLAAMGARPLAAFLSIATPCELAAAGQGKSWMTRFLDGLFSLADRFDLPLAGGDTAQSPEFDERGRKHSALVIADIILVGSVKRGHALLRSGARAGDVIYVTGELGGAAAELLAVGRNPERFAALIRAEEKHPHLYPQPRIQVGLNVASARKANAAIDLSDGLSTDLLHVCEESGLAANLDAAAIPIHPLALQAESDGWVSSAIALALHGGEDYELLFTAPKWSRVPRKIAGVNIHPIGQMQPRRPRQPRLVLHEHDGKTTPLAAGGWAHFS